MPFTPEQLRLKELFAGNPQANRALPDNNPAPVGQTPAYQAYQTPEMEYTGNLGTTPAPQQQPYEQAIANRFNQITQQGQNATMATAQDQQQKNYNAQIMSGMPSPNFPKVKATNSAGGYQYTGAKTGNERRNAVLAAAASQKGMPYSWGGGNSKGPSYGLSGAGERHGSSHIYGFDCSGLVQYAFAQVGIKLPRGGNAQLATGTRMPINKLSPGDLVGHPGHIAVYAGNGMMWEAPTWNKKVRLVPVRSGMFGVHVNY